MNSRSQTGLSHKKMTTWNIMSPFFTALAGVGIGILFGCYLGVI